MYIAAFAEQFFWSSWEGDQDGKSAVKAVPPIGRFDFPLSFS
jgi:hypothetical protein